MTKEQIIIEAKSYNKGLKQHPLSERALTDVLVEFALHLQNLKQYSVSGSLPPVSQSYCGCGVPLVREKHSDLMFGDRYFDIEGYYCPKCGELHSVNEF